MTRTFRTLLTVITLTVVVADISAPVAVAESAKARADRLQREHQRRVQEAERKAALQEKASGSNRRSTSSSSGTSSGTTSGFNASRAPAPETCLAEYIQAVRRASSLSSVLKYIPPGERERLQAEQDRFDPREARTRRQQLLKEGRMDRELIDRITTAPFDRELAFRKQVAEKIESLKSVRQDGNRATITANIRINDVINGQVYTRSTASIGMIGEGSSWYFSSFSESNAATR